MDHGAAEVFANQHGAGTRQQLLAELKESQLDHLHRRGDIARVARSVYVPRGIPVTPELVAKAAQLRCGDAARVIGPRVLHWLGLRRFRRDSDFGVLVPDIGRLRRVQVCGEVVRVFRDPVPNDGTRSVNGFAIPSPARLMVEMTRFCEGADLRSAIDAGRWEDRPSLRQLHDEVLRLPINYVPAADMRRVLQQVEDFQLESEGERLLRAALGTLAREFSWQHHVTPGIRVDAYHPRGIVLEYDGREDHDSVDARRRDAQRDQELRRLGIIVIRLTAADLANPTALRRRIAALLAD